MKTKLIAFVTALLVTFTGTAHMRAAELELLRQGEIIVATDPTFAPFSTRGPDGDLHGLEIVLMQEVAKRLGLEYKPVLVKWESLLIGLEADQFDITTAAMDITPERQKAVVFIDSWLESGGRVVVGKGSDIKKPADIKGRSIGVIISSTWAVVAENLGAEIRGYKSEADVMQDLINGNIDGIITDSIAAAYAIVEKKLPVEMLDDYVSRIQKGWAVKKGKPELVKAINQVLADMIADGTYERLTSEIIGYSPAPKDPIRSLL